MSLILNGTSGLFGNVTGGDISGNFIGLSGNGSSLTATATGSTTARSLANRFADVINVKDFGAVGDGIENDTAAIQAAIDYAKINLKKVSSIFIPAGIYLVDTIYLTAGINIFGTGTSETSGFSNTLLQQNSSVDVIRFDVTNIGKKYWLGSIKSLSIFGKQTNPSGWGISFRNKSDETVSLQDTSSIIDVSIRRFPSGGIEVPNAGLPITFQRIKLLFNNGPGIHITSVTNNQHQAIDLIDISGDGNNGGLIKLSGLDRSGSVNIINMKSEARINVDYGKTTADQQNPIVCNDCNDSPITILGATHICSEPSGSFFVKPGSLIKILDTDFPIITWDAVAIRVRAGDVGPDPFIIEGFSNAPIEIPYTTTHGFFGYQDTGHFSPYNGIKQTLGTSNSYQADSVEDTAFQVNGTTPAYSLYESDGPVDAKAWILVASNGEMTLRAINDNGTVGQFIWTAKRNRFDIGPDQLGTYLRINGINNTSASSGSASALPAFPQGYINININGNDRKIPYYI